jgi:hypothetical protein
MWVLVALATMRTHFKRESVGEKVYIATVYVLLLIAALTAAVVVRLL